MSLVQPFNPGDVNIAPNNRDGLSHKINMLSAVDFNSFVPLNFPPTGSLGLVPALNDTYDIGTTALRWRTAYMNDLLVETIVADNAMTIASLNNVTIQSSTGSVVVTAVAGAFTVDVNNGISLQSNGGGFDLLADTGNMSLATTTGNIYLNSDTITEVLKPAATNTKSVGAVGQVYNAMYATTFNGALSGNATTATTLATARNINGVSFNGSADITVTAAAGTLSGSTLAAGVTASSLTSVATLGSLTVTGATTTGSVVTPSIVTASNTDLNIIPDGTGDLWFSKVASLTITLGANKSLATATSWTVDWDNGSTAFKYITGDSITFASGAPSVITINKTGYYLFTVCGYWQGNATGERILYLNFPSGNFIDMVRGGGFSASQNVYGNSKIVYITSPQTVQLVAYQTSGSTISLYGKGYGGSGSGIGQHNGLSMSIQHVSL
jgi:hypothetical protein